MKQFSSDKIPLLVADVFQLAGDFRRLGDRIAGSVGQTQARWQVLSVASGGSHTVAQMARRLGYARQSVQRTADQLVSDGLARYSPNPDHKSSPLCELTPAGAGMLGRIEKAATKWHTAIANEIDSRDLATALRIVRNLRQAVEEQI
ncbi:MAG: MarR family winged helix-turn-helix transcriptional regulator [Bryobacteraceae bacterium]